MVSSLVFGWFVLLADEYAHLGKHVASGAAFIINFILANEVGYFDLSVELKPMLHLWSLAVEEQFYIVWPLCLWLAWKKKFNLLAVTLIVLLISSIWNLTWITVHPTETFYWPFSRFWEFLSGSVLAWFTVKKRKFLYSEKLNNLKCFNYFVGEASIVLQSTIAVNAMSLVGFLLLASSTLLLDYQLPFPSAWALLPIVGALLVIGAGSKALLNRVFLMNPIAVWFGLISYPLYLWHWPILSYLHIIEIGTPDKYLRIAAVSVSIFLAWVTFKLIEIPIRFGKAREKLKSISLVVAMVALGGIGVFVGKNDFSDVRKTEALIFNKRLENRIGSSNRWYEGKDDWLFLGNSYDHTVEKLRLSTKPKNSDIESLKSILSGLSEVAEDTQTQLAMVVGPNKSTIYSEFLPTQFVPSDKRYFSFFADVLKDVPNLVLYDPTGDFLRQKEIEGILYYRTDTHWNSKAAFLTYEGMANRLGLPVPDVNFELNSDVYPGDLLGIAGLEDFPLEGGDSWRFTIEQTPKLMREDVSALSLTQSFGAQEIVVNSNALSDKTAWVVGDSFSGALSPYIYSTFRKTYFLGHWSKRLADLAADLRNASEKPDVIIVVRVERSF